MKTIEDIYSSFSLSHTDIEELSTEAKDISTDCGKKGILKELSAETWDLFDKMAEKVWMSDLPTFQKISLGFELFEMFPSYYHFLTPFYHAINNNEIAVEAEKEIIWDKFIKYLGAENYYADPVGYVLWVEFFEDVSTVRETWTGLMNVKAETKAWLRLLEFIGPVPYDLKQPFYNRLLSDTFNHKQIFTSLLYSAYDAYGQIDKVNARVLLAKLDVDKDTEEYISLMEKLK